MSNNVCKIEQGGEYRQAPNKTFELCLYKIKDIPFWWLRYEVKENRKNPNKGYCTT